MNQSQSGSSASCSANGSLNGNDAVDVNNHEIDSICEGFKNYHVLLFYNHISGPGRSVLESCPAGLKFILFKPLCFSLPLFSKNFI